MCHPYTLFPVSILLLGMAKKQERGSKGRWNILWSKATTPALDHLRKREINISLVQLTIILVSITCIWNCILTTSSFSFFSHVCDRRLQKCLIHALIFPPFISFPSPSLTRLSLGDFLLNNGSFKIIAKMRSRLLCECLVSQMQWLDPIPKILVINKCL